MDKVRTVSMNQFGNVCMKHFLMALVFLASSSSIWAWGRVGHAAIANIASANLTPAATAQVNALLHNDLDGHLQASGRTSLAAVASWADEIREIAPKNTYKGWHSRANPVCSNDLGKCTSGHCVDQNIMHFRQVLQDRNQPARARNEALKWIVHLVGDLHMPMHSGAHGKDIEVTLAGKKLRNPVTLHNVWDSNLAEMALKQGAILPALDHHLAPLAADAPTQWMLETRTIARQYTYDPLPGFSCATTLQGPIELDKAYQQQALPVIRAQISAAGLRLAQLLNETLQ